MVDNIDNSGYRYNVGMILANTVGKLLWARRIQNADSWQFPQGGMQLGETPEEALYRELYEEIGLYPANVKVISSTNTWLSYRLPKHLVREQHQSPRCIGQKQKWYLLQLCGDDCSIQLDTTTDAEFDRWQWVSYWYPLSKIVAFKREVYRCALRELSVAHSQLESVN